MQTTRKMFDLCSIDRAAGISHRTEKVSHSIRLVCAPKLMWISNCWWDGVEECYLTRLTQKSPIYVGNFFSFLFKSLSSKFLIVVVYTTFSHLRTYKKIGLCFLGPLFFYYFAVYCHLSCGSNSRISFIDGFNNDWVYISWKWLFTFFPLYAVHLVALNQTPFYGKIDGKRIRVDAREKRKQMTKEDIDIFLFQLGDTPNPELRIITSVFNKVVYRGELRKRIYYLSRRGHAIQWKSQRNESRARVTADRTLDLSHLRVSLALSSSPFFNRALRFTRVLPRNYRWIPNDSPLSRTYQFTIVSFKYIFSPFCVASPVDEIL